MMKRYRITAWTGPGGDLLSPDYTATFPSRTLTEALNDKDGFAARFLEAVAIEADPWRVVIEEVVE